MIPLLRVPTVAGSWRPTAPTPPPPTEQLPLTLSSVTAPAGVLAGLGKLAAPSALTPAGLTLVRAAIAEVHVTAQGFAHPCGAALEAGAIFRSGPATEAGRAGAAAVLARALREAPDGRLAVAHLPQLARAALARVVASGLAQIDGSDLLLRWAGRAAFDDMARREQTGAG